MMRYLLILISCIWLLSACSNPNTATISISQTSQNNKPVDDAFLQELQSNKAELRRLVAMEQDLKVLISALSNQSDIQRLPSTLRDTPEVKKHQLGSSEKQVLEADKEIKLGFLLNLQPMFSEASAQAQLNKVHTKYPQLSRFLSSSIHQRQLNNQTRFIGVFSLIKSQSDAEKLCAIINNIGVLCSVTENR